MKNYKVETRQGIWEIITSHGSYSDYTEDHYFIRANTKDEVWHLFKEYWDDISKDGRNEFHALLVFETQQYIPTKDGKPIESPFLDKWGWDTNYGDANEVTIKPLDLIVFSNARKPIDGKI
jgi:hypothetical protein